VRSSVANTRVMKHFRITDPEIKLTRKEKHYIACTKLTGSLSQCNQHQVTLGPNSATSSGTAFAAMRKTHVKHIQTKSF